MAEALRTAFPTRVSRFAQRISSRVPALTSVAETVGLLSEQHARKKAGREATQHLQREGVGYRQELEASFGNVEFFLGVTAVHGVEPQQIAINTALAINRELERNGMEPKPVIIPYLEGHPSYGKVMKEIIDSVYPDQKHLIYLSEDLGRILQQTEYIASLGYQNHLQRVRDNQPKVRQELLQLVDREFSVVRLSDGQGIRVNGKGRDEKRIIEINAGANASAATEDRRVVSYTVFPNTFHGLLEFIRVMNKRSRLGYSESLLSQDDVYAKALDRQMILNFLSEPNPLEGFSTRRKYTDEMRDKIVTPPLKEMLTPPQVKIEGSHIRVTDADGTVAESSRYDPDKGLIHVNISGNTTGAEAVRALVLKAQKDGYVITAPPWLKELWLTTERQKGSRMDPDVTSQIEQVLPVGPSMLFAKGPDGKPLCKAFIMRPGLGSIWYALVSGVPILSLERDPLDNPEMEGNNIAIEQFGLGKTFNGQADAIEEVAKLAVNIPSFVAKIRRRYRVPEGMSGLDFVGKVIINAETARVKKR